MKRIMMIIGLLSCTVNLVAQYAQYTLVLYYNGDDAQQRDMIPVFEDISNSYSALAFRKIDVTESAVDTLVDFASLQLPVFFIFCKEAPIQVNGVNASLQGFAAEDALRAFIEEYTNKGIYPCSASVQQQQQQQRVITYSIPEVITSNPVCNANACGSCNRACNPQMQSPSRHEVNTYNSSDRPTSDDWGISNPGPGKGAMGKSWPCYQGTCAPSTGQGFDI